MKLSVREINGGFYPDVPRRIASSLLFLSLLCAPVGGTADAQGEIVFRIDYESRSLNVEAFGIVAEKPSADDSIVVDCAIARRGQCSVRTLLRRSERYVSFGSYRAETDSRASKLSWYRRGDVFRYQFSLHIPSDWEHDNDASIDIVWQFKRFAQPADAFVAIKGRNIVFRLGPQEQLVLVKDYPLGRWIDFRIDVTWSDKQDGHIAVATRIEPKADYIEVAKRRGQNMWGPPINSGYVKWGLYKPAFKNSTTSRPRVVFHDEIMVQRLDANSSK